jgi:hypothetical protein
MIPSVWCLAGAACPSYNVTIKTLKASTIQYPVATWNAVNNVTVGQFGAVSQQYYMCVSTQGSWAITEMSSVLPATVVGNWTVTSTVTDVSTGAMSSMMPLNFVNGTANPFSVAQFTNSPSTSSTGLMVAMTLLKFDLESAGGPNTNTIAKVAFIVGNSTLEQDLGTTPLTASLNDSMLKVSLMLDPKYTAQSGVVTWYCASSNGTDYPPSNWFLTPLGSNAVVVAGHATSGKLTFSNVSIVEADLKPCGNISDPMTKFLVGASISLNSTSGAVFSVLPQLIAVGPSPPSAPAPAVPDLPKPNNGKVIGFVTGGVALVIILIGGIVYYVRGRSRNGYVTV